MKIFIDINHPAHVHYFRNFIKIMEKKKHKFLISARNKDITLELLNKYNIKFFSRGSGGKSRIGKIIYVLWADILLFLKNICFRPNIYISFSSPYAAHCAFFFRKHHISLTDTEHADKIHKFFTYPFSKAIITPASYYNDLGRKHIRFNNIIESLYLDSKYFTPNKNILEKIGVSKNDKYALLRFVSWDAHHDFGESGMSKEIKMKIINILENHSYKVFISSESELEENFEKYRLNLSPEKIHHLMYYSSLFIGESGTMASESAFLGVPTIYINTLPLMGYLKHHQKYGLLRYFSGSDGVVDFLKKALKNELSKESFSLKAHKMKENFINSTDFLVWFVENYPNSHKTILQDTK